MMMDVDIQDKENNNDLYPDQHALLQPQTLATQQQRTDVEDTQVQTPIQEEYDTIRSGHVTPSFAASESAIAAEASTSERTITAAHLQEGEGVLGQRRLSIQDLLTNGNGNGRPSLHSAHSSPGSTGTGTSSPRYWDWPFPPSCAAGSIHKGDESPQSRTHSPIPFPPPRSRAPSKRPVPISTGSSPFPYSSLRSSARASASPYPPAQVTPVGLGINMETTASPSPSADNTHHRISPAAAAGFTSPSGGSISSNRRGPKPDWPSPRKKDVRSQSFNTSHPHSSALTPKEWYAQTPTILRVPPSAQLHSPATPVSIAGSGSASARRPGPGAPSASAPAVASARRVHLSDVPKSKLIHALNSKAAEYWFRPETADCRIYVPISKKRLAEVRSTGADMEGQDSSPDSAMGEGHRGAFWPPTPAVPVHVDPSERDRVNVVSAHGKTSGTGRRGSMPESQDVPLLVFPLHRDYLIIQSTLLRTLLSTNSSLDISFRTSPTRPGFAAGANARPTSPSPGTPQARSFPTPRPAPGAQMKDRGLKGARILPSREGEPISVFLPLPDPASFGVVLHWLYWGDVTSLEQALSRRLVTWQGIVKNIEYLSMDDSIKRVMGKWWRTWVKTDVGRARQRQQQADERSSRGVSVSASSEGGNDTDDDRGAEADDEGMQVDVKGHEQGQGEEDGVSDLLKNL